MNNHKKGDLVYIPSSVTLYQFGDLSAVQESEWLADVGKSVKRHKTTEKPRNVLVIEGDTKGYAQILYDSERWYVRDKDVFSIGDKQC